MVNDYNFFLIANLCSVIFTLNGVDSRARPGLEERVKLGVLAEPARVAEEGIFLIVVDGPTLVALVDVLPARPTHPWVGRDRRLAPRTLENLGISLQRDQE
jgi:hypothetical protein